MNQDFILTIILLALVLSILTWVAIRTGLKRFFKKEKIPLPKNFSKLALEHLPEFNSQNKKLKGQSEDWQKEMSHIGSEFQNLNTKAFFFVHGTFVGSDPTGLTKHLKIIFRNKGKFLEREIQRIVRNSSDKILRDQGNFTRKYIELFQKATNNRFPCLLFNWSSENHHLARLEAVCKLITLINQSMDRYNWRKGDSIMLIGHSHAGQLFAILYNLLYERKKSTELIKICNEANFKTDEIIIAINRIKLLDFKFVTLGTPHFYPWPKKANSSILHLINHRGDIYNAGCRKGILTTKFGDYIQQFGISGSDFPATSNKERVLNKKMDKLLAIGSNPVVWQKNLKSMSKISNSGYTYLIDYKDESNFIPNFAKTILGHGVYTQYKVMLFTMKLIVKHFSSDKDPK